MTENNSHKPDPGNNRDKLLAEFFEKRKSVNEFLEKHGIRYVTCPGCAYPTLAEQSAYEICQVCDWEDDGQDDPVADEIWGGPNGDLSLTQNRLDVGQALADITVITGGRINLNPIELICILHPNNKPLVELMIRLAKPSDIVPHRFIHFPQRNQTLIWQLISLKT